MKTKKERKIPLRCLISAAVGLVALGVRIAANYFPAFADFFNDNISFYLRAVLAYVTAWVPFSVAEYALLGMPLIVALICYAVIKCANKKGFVRAISSLVAVVILLFSVFTFNFGVGYETTPLDARLGIEKHDVSAESLYETTLVITERLGELESKVKHSGKQGFVSPHTEAETVAICSDAYTKLNEKYGFIKSFRVPVKTMILSPVLTYTFITGEYTFFTGEANINNNYPDYVNIFTTAHEMAHQRGVSREDEANFVAFLVCINADDPSVRYAGYLSMYEYLSGALYDADKTIYSQAANTLPASVRYDLRCASEFLQKYKGSPAADITDSVNDAYLTVQGTDGVESYGLVVDLAVAYYKK